MNSNSMTYQAYVQILKEELLPAMGCTEPIAIAYCAAKARDVLGEIPASIKVEAAGYSTSTRAVTAARTYPNLSDADVSLIPKSIEDGGRTLELANVQWQEAGEFYTANATYTGTASSKYATGYTVTAEYSGEVSKTTNDTVTYAALFSANPNKMQPAAKSGKNWRGLLVLPAGAAAAGLFFGGKFLLKKHKSKKNWEEYTK